MFRNEKNWRIFNTFEKQCIYNSRYDKQSADKIGEKQISKKTLSIQQKLKKIDTNG